MLLCHVSLGCQAARLSLFRFMASLPGMCSGLQASGLHAACAPLLADASPAVQEGVLVCRQGFHLYLQIRQSDSNASAARPCWAERIATGWAMYTWAS